MGKKVEDGLSKTFNKHSWGWTIARTILFSGIGIAIGMAIPAGDLMAFPYIHGAEGNGNLQAAMALIHDKLSFIPESMGWEGDGGLLNVGWAQEMLAPYQPLNFSDIANAGVTDYSYTPPVEVTSSVESPFSTGAASPPAAPFSGGLSLDDLL